MRLSLFLIVMAGSISMACQEHAVNPLTLKIESGFASGNIEIEMCNESKATLRLFSTGNSWGDSRWRVLVLRKDRLDVWIQQPNQIYTRNFPAYEELQPGKCLVRALDLRNGDWAGKHNDFHPESGETLLAIYEVPVTSESKKRGVWSGFAVARKIME